MSSEKKVEGLNFYQKLKLLQTIMGDFQWEKDGLNRYQSYKYVTEKQYKNNFKKALKQTGLLWKVETIDVQFFPEISEKQNLVICKQKGCLIDPETGEKEEFIFFGSGSDVADKGLYKAITGGQKYFLSTNYNVAEDFEPESDQNEVMKIVPPASVETRESLKEEIINNEGSATKMQINSLKKALAKLIELDPEQQDFVNDLMTKTNELQNLTKKKCEEIILKVGEIIEELERS